MKRIVAIVLVLMLVSGYCFASDTISKTVYSYGLKNTSATLYLNTIIPITSIRPLVDKIIGYSIQPLNGNHAEIVIGIFDGTDVQLLGEVFAENEATTPSCGTGEIWTFGRTISSGVVVRQGPNTQAQIYFVRE